MRRDIKRDEAICFAYTYRTEGKYKAKTKDIAKIYKISEARMYQILKRNGIKKRREVE